MEKTKLTFHNLDYMVESFRCIKSDSQVPRLVIPAYQPNATASEILDITIASIQKYTQHDYELWVVDNASPPELADRLLDQNQYNVVLNRTQPKIPERTLQQKLLKKHPYTSGSYANAIGLEIASACIDPSTQFVMTLHMDIMVCQYGWLSFLMSKLNNNSRASGVRLDKARTKEGILHVLGMLFDFQLFQELELDFFPSLPRYDVGDKVSDIFRAFNHTFHACHNTLWQPELISQIPDDSPLKNIKVDRSFDDDGKIFFLHLGRGSLKSTGDKSDGTSVEQWKNLAYEHILKERI